MARRARWRGGEGERKARTAGEGGRRRDREAGRRREKVFCIKKLSIIEGFHNFGIDF